MDAKVLSFAAARRGRPRSRPRADREYVGMYAALTERERPGGSNGRLIESYARGCSITELAVLFELSRGEVEARIYDWTLHLLADHAQRVEGLSLRVQR